MSEYIQLKLDDGYKAPEFIEIESERYINELWIATCIFLENILNSSEISSLYVEHIGDVNQIKIAFRTSDEYKFGVIVSNFYRSIISYYPIINTNIQSDINLMAIYRLLYNVHDIIKYYIDINIPFKYGKCIRFYSIYNKFITDNIDYNYDSIKNLILQLKKRIK